MAGRIRTIKPELLEDEKTAALSDRAWRLFVSVILIADDHGCMRALPRYLRSTVWWAHDLTDDEVADALAELVESEIVVAYEASGQLYAHIRNWEKHQRMDNAGKRRVPGVNEGKTCDSERVREFSAVRRESPRGSAVRGSTTTTTYDHQDVGSSNLAGSGDPAGFSAPPESAPAGPDQACAASAPASVPAQPSLLPTEPSKPSPVAEVFDHYLAGWRRVVRGTRAPKLDDKRRKLCKARIADGFTVDDLKAACDGLWSSEFHIEKGFTGFDLVMRDVAHVEQFMGRRRSHTGSMPVQSTPLPESPPNPGVLRHLPTPAPFRPRQGPAVAQNRPENAPTPTDATTRTPDSFSGPSRPSNEASPREALS